MTKLTFEFSDRLAQCMWSHRQTDRQTDNIL